MITFNVLLPSKAQIEQMLSNQFKFDKAHSHHLDNISITNGKLRYITGVTLYEWTNEDYEFPFKVYSVAKWSFYAEHGHWDFKVVNFKTLEDRYTWQQDFLNLPIIGE